MKYILKGIGYLEFFSGFFLLILIPLNIFSFFNYFGVWEFALFLILVILLINAGYLIMFFYKSGIILSIFAQAIQVTSLPIFGNYYNIRLFPFIHLNSYKNSTNIELPEAFACFALNENYYFNINIISLILILILFLCLVIDQYRKHRCYENIKDYVEI